MSNRSTFAIVGLRLGFPAALIVIGILTIAGCVYIPVPEHPRAPDGRDVRNLVGGAASDKPLRVGLVSREAVLRILGRPSLRTARDSAVGYDFLAVAGHRYGLCVEHTTLPDVRGPFYYPDTIWAHYVLYLEFNADGLLKRYQLKRWQAGEAGERPAWDEFIRTIPDDPATPVH